VTEEERFLYWIGKIVVWAVVLIVVLIVVIPTVIGMLLAYWPAAAWLLVSVPLFLWLSKRPWDRLSVALMAVWWVLAGAGLLAWWIYAGFV
jgi:hypothetical protein